LRRQNQAGWIKAGAVNVEASIWVAGSLMAILGVIKAAYSEQSLLWLAVWLPLRSPPRFLSSSVKDSISEMGCWSLAAGAVDFVSGAVNTPVNYPIVRIAMFNSVRRRTRFLLAGYPTCCSLRHT